MSGLRKVYKTFFFFFFFLMKLKNLFWILSLVIMFVTALFSSDFFVGLGAGFVNGLFFLFLAFIVKGLVVRFRKVKAE